MILTLLFKGDSCLHQAARKGTDNVVKYLVSFGAELSAVNNEVSHVFLLYQDINMEFQSVVHLSDITY